MVIPPMALSILTGVVPALVLIGILSGVAAAHSDPLPARPGDQVTFKKIIIDPEFRSEGVAVADVNRDGKLDIIAGNLWYEAPNWTPHEIEPVQKFDGATGYSNSFLVFAADVNGDGWPDEIVFGFPGQKAFWRENPQGKTGPWKEHPICPHAYDENPAFAGLLGNGKPVLVFGSDPRSMAWWEPSQDLDKDFIRHLIDDPGTQIALGAHGLGVGDLTGNGRMDIVTPKGFWLAPEDRSKTPWTFTPADLGPDCADMAVVDVNGDGLPDVISSSAHQIGVWWWEQVKDGDKISFRKHVIDDSYSQSHALAVGDINGDGLPDLVVGKRKWAHGTHGDIRPDDPAVLYWYELQRKDGKVNWIRHLIDSDSGVGLQVIIADVNGDGKPDIVMSNKNGVFLFLQE